MINRSVPLFRSKEWEWTPQSCFVLSRTVQKARRPWWWESFIFWLTKVFRKICRCLCNTAGQHSHGSVWFFFLCMISFQVYLLYSTAVPSPELVDHIRDLYHKRVPDVRFLIPVLNGLSKVRLLIRRLFWNIFKLTRWYLPLTTVKFVTFR